MGEVRKSPESLAKTITASQWRRRRHIYTSPLHPCVIPWAAGRTGVQRPHFEARMDAGEHLQLRPMLAVGQVPREQKKSSENNGAMSFAGRLGV